MAGDVEELARQRRLLLLAETLTFGVWYAAWMLHLIPWLAPGLSRTLAVLSQAAGLCWVTLLLWFVIWMFRVKARPKVFAALNDEMTVRNRSRATRASMVVVMASLAVGLGLVDYIHISAAAALGFLVWILVLSQTSFYLWFDRNQ